jgi:von Willebrand factor type A domain
MGQGNRLETMKEAVTRIIGTTNIADQIALITIANEPEVFYNGTFRKADDITQGLFAKVIEKLSVKGETPNYGLAFNETVRIIRNHCSNRRY